MFLNEWENKISLSKDLKELFMKCSPRDFLLTNHRGNFEKQLLTKQRIVHVYSGIDNRILFDVIIKLDIEQNACVWHPIDSTG